MGGSLKYGGGGNGKMGGVPKIWGGSVRNGGVSKYGGGSWGGVCRTVAEASTECRSTCRESKGGAPGGRQREVNYGPPPHRSALH